MSIKPCIVFLTLFFTFAFTFTFTFSCNNDSKPKKSTVKNKSLQQLLQEPSYQEIKQNIKVLNYKKAVSLLKPLLNKYPKNAELYYQFAIITKNTTPDPLEAIKLLQIAVALDEAHGKSWQLLGDLFFIRNDMSKALKSWELALETIKNDALLYYRLALLYKQQKDFQLALKYFQKSQKLNPKYPWNYYYIANIKYLQFKDIKTAIKELQKGIQQVPDSSSLQETLADYHKNNLEYNKALSIYLTLIKTKPKNAYLLEKIVTIYRHQKNIKEALFWLNKILTQKPKSTYHLKIATELYMDSNRIDEAMNTLKYIHILEPNNSEVKIKLANLYKIKGKTEAYNQLMKDLKTSGNPSDVRVMEYIKE